MDYKVFIGDKPGRNKKCSILTMKRLAHNIQQSNNKKVYCRTVCGGLFNVTCYYWAPREILVKGHFSCETTRTGPTLSRNVQYEIPWLKAGTWLIKKSSRVVNSTEADWHCGNVWMETTSYLEIFQTWMSFSGGCLSQLQNAVGDSQSVHKRTEISGAFRWGGGVQPAETGRNIMCLC